MQKFEVIKELDLTGDIGSFIRVKSKIKDWADSLPYHPYSDFSEIVKIKSIRKRPVYMIRVKSMLNSRTLQRRRIPYNGQELPKLKFASERDVDVWSFDLDVCKGFDDVTESFMIPESQRAEKCSACFGTGGRKCGDCKGEGTVECSNCDGYGKLDCPTCDGRGVVRCKDCSGRGTYTEEKLVPGGSYYYTEDINGNRVARYKERIDRNVVRCKSCGGKGDYSCNRCKTTGRVVCDVCHGKKRVVCDNCSGKGSVVCSVCNGKKYMVDSLVIEKSVRGEEVGTFVTFGSTFDDFAEFKDCFKKFKRSLIFSKVVKGMASDEILPVRSYIDKNLQRLLSKARDLEGPGLRTEKQLVEVEELNTWIVDYSFILKDYSMLLVGDELEVIPGANPISEVEERYIASGDKMMEEGKPAEAYDFYSKAWNIGAFEYIDEVNDKLDKCSAIIKKSHVIGAVIGTVLAAAVIIPFCRTYYFDVNWMFGYAEFLKDPGFFLAGHHPWAVLAFSVLFLYSSYVSAMELMSNKIRFRSGAGARIGLAVLVAFGLALLLQSTVVLLNATGFMHIFTLIAWLFTFWV